MTPVLGTNSRVIMEVVLRNSYTQMLKGRRDI